MTVKIDMEMPKSCTKCQCAFWDPVYLTIRCPFLERELSFVQRYADTRISFCPLQEVKECK